MNSTGPFAGSSFKPSCSCNATAKQGIHPRLPCRSRTCTSAHSERGQVRHKESLLPATEDCRLSDARQERLQYGDYDARWWPNVVFPHEDRVRFDSRFGLCPCKISLEIAEKYNLETPPDIRPHKSNSVHIARFGVYNSQPDRAFLLRFALTADGNVSILFKNHSLAPAYHAILAGRPLAISLIKFAEIEYGMEAKNWGIPRRDLMRRFLTRFALLRPGLGAMIGLSDGHKRPTI